MVKLSELRKPQFIVPLLAIGAGVSLCFFFNLRLEDEKAVNGQLNQVLDDALKEKEQLQARIAEIEQQVREKDDRLRQLSDAVALRDSLDKAQKVIEQLNTEIMRINTERAALQNANLNLNAKIQGLTRELTRNVSELKVAREDVSQTGMAAVRQKSEELSKSVSLKDKELSGLKSEIKRLQQLNQELVQQNAEIERKAGEVRKVKQAGAAAEVDAAGATIASLKETVAEKAGQIRRLEAELEELRTADSAAAAGSSGQQKKVSELGAKNVELVRRIADLEAQLASAQQESQSAQRSAAVDKSRAQLNKLSDLLVKKELEIDTVKRDALDAKEKIIGLQSKLSSLEAAASQNKNNEDKIRSLESKLLLMQGKAGDLQQSIEQKTELADSLQKNIAFLTQQLAKKDEEIRAIGSRYSAADSASKEELERQRARYDEANMLYSSLKTQVEQFQEALNLKEAELVQRRKETTQYREDIAGLRSRAEVLEKDLVDAKDRQKRTLDDLIASVKLNTILQEKITGASVPSKGAAAQQQKADDLKRRVEIMLEPQEQKAP